MRKMGSVGFTITEVLFGLMMLGLIALVLGRTMLFMNKHDTDTQEKEQANEICLQLMQEVRAYAEVNTAEDIDTLEDNTNYNEMLALSWDGFVFHRQYNAFLKFSRQINVFTVEGESQSRRVRVRVFRKGGSVLLAETTGFVRKTTKNFPTIQRLRMYSLLLPKYPVYNSPNLKMDIHYLSDLVHKGRNRVGYKPELVTHLWDPPFNSYSTNIPTKKVYLHSSSIGSVDAFNHGTRQPTCALGKPDCLRSLLDKMVNNDADYRNVVLVNPGSIFYLPPIRNYSDAARDPEVLLRRYARAVTHPERIGVATGAEVRLRVYTYTTRPDLLPVDAPLAEVTVVLKTPIDATKIEITRILGDDGTTYSAKTPVGPGDATIKVFASSTVIHLFNSPQRHAYHAFTETGLPADRRLYGLEYIPCPVKDGDWFDLTSNSPDKAKNTARWIIRLSPGSVPDGLLTVETRIGADLTAGTIGNGLQNILANKPANLSETYVWAGIPVPLTEQFQFLGDPRHMPYMDVKESHGYNWFFVQVNSADGYEGFGRTQNGWLYKHQLPNFTTDEERVNFDFPRYMQVIRTALLNSNSLYMVGDSSLGLNRSYTPMAFVSFGADVGMAETKTGVVPLRAPRNAWNPDSSVLKNSFELGASMTDVDNSYQRLVASTDNSWMCMPWLDELYPDDMYNTWKSQGNLPAVPGVNGFYRARYSTFAGRIGLLAGTDFSAAVAGASLGTLLNGNTGGTGNNYAYAPYLGEAPSDYSATWKTIENLFQIYMGRNSDNTTSSVDLNASASNHPPAYTDSIYEAQRTELTLVRNFMSPRGGYETSALIRMADPLNANRVGYVITNGNAKSDWNYNLGAVQDFALAAWGFMEMGSPLDPLGVQPIPRVSFSAPQTDEVLQNPSAVTVSWNTEWLRADGEPYTPYYPDGYTHAGAVVYNLSYSDNGVTSWIDMLTKEPRILGKRSLANKVTSPHTWDVSTLPAGRYVLRVEAYRAEGEQHFAYHDRRIEIKR